MGLNDISIIAGIIAVFIIIGAFLPVINAAFGVPPEESACFDISTVESELQNATRNIGVKDIQPTITRPTGSFSIFDVVASIIKMFFWTCGALPTWLDLVFLIFRITLILTIARNLWVGGGG